ncbi:hypothetical protein OC834_006807 [Tilletia horrida]|uniref:Uncharacterized protein n=1 Tax=Tilletia horrida TaxID=155126 RepID=A0AAN6GH47_9BASI|nr:hypothetical protein OC834_006807 [Tilletia horrida]KAK0539130.1 hypothetical protein OC842_001064 [Tilletia horrida]
MSQMTDRGSFAGDRAAVEDYSVFNADSHLGGVDPRDLVAPMGTFDLARTPLAVSSAQPRNAFRLSGDSGSQLPWSALVQSTQHSGAELTYGSENWVPSTPTAHGQHGVGASPPRKMVRRDGITRACDALAQFPEGALPAAVQPRPLAASSSAATTTSEQSNRLVLRTYLQQGQGQAFLQQEVRKWVNAGMDTVAHDLKQTVSATVRDALQEYASVVEAFRSRLVLPDEGGLDNPAAPLEPSSDGYLYLRLNEPDLERYLGAFDAIMTKLKADEAKRQADLAAINQRIAALELLSANASKEPCDPSKKTQAKGKATKEHPHAKAQADFKAIVGKLAGIAVGRGAADGQTKIWELPFPDDPSKWEYHPATYIASEVDTAVPASQLAAGAATAYRCLRFDLSVGWDASPNVEQLLPILRMMVRDHEKHQLGPAETPQSLMKGPFRRTWANWVRRYKARQDRSAEQIAAEEEQERLKKRRHARIQAKCTRRWERAQVLMKRSPDDKRLDIHSLPIFEPELQSDEFSEDEVVLPGSPTPRNVRIVQAPAYRSDECEMALRSLEPESSAGPRKFIVERGETFDLDRGARLWGQFPRWAFKKEWVDRNSAAAPTFVANIGPWSGVDSVATGPMEFGTGSYDASTSNTRRKNHPVTVLMRPGHGSAVATRPRARVHSASDAGTRQSQMSVGSLATRPLLGESQVSSRMSVAQLL